MDTTNWLTRESIFESNLNAITRSFFQFCGVDDEEDDTEFEKIVKNRCIYVLKQTKIEKNLFDHCGLSQYSYDCKEKNAEFSTVIRKKNNEHYNKLSSTFNQGAYIEIINDYSKSLSFAPTNSEEYALALSNRSIVLFRILKFEECLLDVDTALKISKNPTTKFKLLCRKIECLARLGKKVEKHKSHSEALKIIPLLNEKLRDKCLKTINDAVERNDMKIVNNKKIEANTAENIISKKVSWKHNQKDGNHLIANQDINVGEILIVEDFYCGYPETDYIYVICTNCMKFTLNSIPCKFCVHVVFCSEKCKTQAWNKFHEVECEAYVYFFRYPYLSFKTPIASIVLRTIIMALKEIDIQNLIEKTQEIDNLLDTIGTSFSDAIVKNTHKTFDFVYGLKKTEENYNVEELRIREALSTAILISLKSTTFLGDKINVNNMDEIKKIIWKLLDTYNFHYIYKEDYRYTNSTERIDFGILLPCTYSLLNHNCIPNTSVTFSSNSKLIVFATGPIKKNEQIYASYSRDLLKLKHRKKFLNQFYKINCKCIACMGNWEPIKLPLQKEALRVKYNDIYRFLNSIDAFVDDGSSFISDFKMENVDKLSRFIVKGCSTLSDYDAYFALEEIKKWLKYQYTNIYCPEIVIPEQIINF